MKWRGRRQSENIEDARGMRPGPVVGGGIGILIMAMIIGFLGGDPRRFMQQAQQRKQQEVGPAAAGGPPAELSQRDKERGEFVATVLADSEDVWNKLFAQSKLQYEEPKLKLFTAQVNSGCGVASAAAGPFYCPADRKVYLDTAFFDQLEKQLNAPGDFAQAYVVAHEVGHHVQNLLGKTAELDKIRGRVPQAEYNRKSVMLELQADFYAGVMFHHAQRQKKILEAGDIEEGLRAASAIGDDTLQERSRGPGRANQESFTHGTSEQRVRWFMLGLETGDPAQGDTFNAAQL
ncbi:MAG: neutral zinc metallopeptidase [Rubripirellula sp.]